MIRQHIFCHNSKTKESFVIDQYSTILIIVIFYNYLIILLKHHGRLFRPLYNHVERILAIDGIAQKFSMLMYLSIPVLQTKREGITFLIGNYSVYNVELYLLFYAVNRA